MALRRCQKRNFDEVWDGKTKNVTIEIKVNDMSIAKALLFLKVSILIFALFVILRNIRWLLPVA